MATEEVTTLAPENSGEQEVQFKCGFVVGVTANGKIHFEPIGTDVNTVSMLGCLAFAESKIQHQTGLGTPGYVFDKHMHTLEEAIGALLTWIEDSKNKSNLIYHLGGSDTLR